MVWNIDLDDFNGQCPLSKNPYPLMRLMKKILGGYTPPVTTQQPGTTEVTTEKTTSNPVSTKQTSSVLTEGTTKSTVVTGTTNPPGGNVYIIS
jgi:hypothetical protein